MKYSTPIWKTALIIIGICTVTVAAQAQLIITQDSTAPVDYYRKSPTDGGGGGLVAYKRTEPTPEGSQILNNMIGQGFTTAGAEGPLDLSSVTFRIVSKDTALPENLSVSISIYQGISLATTPADSTLISKQTGNLPSALVVGNFLTFSFGEPVTLTKDKPYSIIFAFEDLTDPGRTIVRLGFDTVGSGIINTANDLGSSARRWSLGWTEDGDDNWSASNQNGFVMYVNTIPIPESSTYALVGGIIAVFSVLVMRRYRRGA